MQLIDETAGDLLALIAADFGPVSAGPSDMDRLTLDWLQYRARLITPRPRSVVWSTETTNALSTYPAIQTIAANLASGSDISPWLSNSIRTRQTDPFADMMFNDWQIMHFHLGNVFATPVAIARTNDLLFAYISANEVVLLDVQPHTARPWTMRELLRVLMRTKPAAVDRYEMKGVLELSNQYTDDQIFQLRKNGMNVAFELDGRFFMSPGLGVATSKHSIRMVLHFQKLRKVTRNLSNAVQTNSLLGVRFEQGQFVLYDKSRSLDLMFMPFLE